MTGIEFISRLTEIGYFNYIETKNLKIVEESLKRHFAADQEFLADFEITPPYQSFDLRFYSCGDGENLFEEGGVIDLIEEMRPLFNKIGLNINYSDDTYDENVHTLVVNNKKYTLAEGSILMWGETIAKFSEMINHELEIQNSQERIYIVTNESYYLVFLTTQQYEFLNKCIKSDKGPVTVENWVTKNSEEIIKLLNR